MGGLGGGCNMHAVIINLKIFFAKQASVRFAFDIIFYCAIFASFMYVIKSKKLAFITILLVMCLLIYISTFKKGKKGNQLHLITTYLYFKVNCLVMLGEGLRICCRCNI